MLLYEWLSTWSKKRPSETAINYRDNYLSWRGLLHRVDRRAMELETMGLGNGDWIGVMLGNIPDVVVLALAIAKVGGVVVPLDPTTGSRELELILSVAPIRGLITRPRGGESAAAGAPEPKRERRKLAPEVRKRLQGTLLTCSIYAPSVTFDAGDAQAVVFTADSAGDAKGVVRSRKELLAITQSIADTLDLTIKDRVLAAVPLFQAYGFDMALAAAFRFGATLFLEDELSDKRMLKALREQDVNFVPGSPAVYQALSNQPTAKPLRTKNLRFLSAGGRLDAALYEAFHRRYGARLLSCYHTSQAGPVTVDIRGLNPDTFGKPFEDVEVRVGENEKEGAIWVRGPGVARKFVGARPAGTDVRRIPVGATDKDGWLRTGDVGKIDRNGRLVLTGREDDVVKIDGRRVALGEVEACIESMPQIAAAQAAVVDDQMGGVIVIARVVSRGRINAEEIINHCAKNLAPYKVPRRVEFCQQLP